MTTNQPKPTGGYEMFQSQLTTTNSSVKSFLPDNHYPELAARASQVEALLDEPIQLDGQWHYLPNLSGRRDGKQAYLAQLKSRPDGTCSPVVVFKSFRHGGMKVSWSAHDESSVGLDSVLQKHREEEYAERKAQALRAREEGRNAAAEVAKQIWEDSPTCTEHPYLKRKKIHSYGLRVAIRDYRARLYRASDGQWREVAAVREGDLLVPMFDEQGNLVNLQRIDANGAKMFLLGGKAQGSRFIIPGSSGRTTLAEGYATAASWHEATADTVIVSFSANNLPIVAKSSPALLVAADNDESRAGEKAAIATCLPYALPPGPGWDWNDYAVAYGLPALQIAIANYAAPIFERPWELHSPIKGPTPIDALWHRLEKAQDFSEVAALAWNLGRRLGLDAPMRFSEDEIIRLIERKAPLGMLNPATLESIRATLVWIQNKRATAAISATEPPPQVLKKYRIGEVMSLPTLSSADYHGVIIVWAPMGSGKTQNIGGPFARWVKSQPNRTLLALCHRQSMVFELSRRLGCTYYKDAESKGRDRAEINAFATCLPSLPKEAHSLIIDGAKYVFIDEITQVIRSLDAKVSCADDLTHADVFEKLKQVIARAECLIAADAGLDERTIEFIKSCRPEGEEIRIIRQKPKEEDVEIEYGFGLHALRQAYQEAAARLMAGEKLWIASGGKNRAIELAEMLALTGKKILLLHADNRANARQKKFWDDPENESKNYDAIISTSVISSGLSIEHKTGQHFSHGMLFTGCSTITPADAIQMLRRVRYLKTYTVVVTPGARRGTDFLDGLIQGMSQAAELKEAKNTIPTDYDKFVAEIETTDTKYRDDFAAGLWWLLEAQGFKLRRMAESVGMAEEQLTALREGIRKERIEAILSSTDIDHEAALALRNTPERTQEQSYCLVRYQIRTSLNVPWGKMTEEDIKDWDEGRGPRRMDRFSAATKGLADMAEKNSSSPHLRLQRYGKAIVRAYGILFEGIVLKPGAEISKQAMELILARAIEQRHLFSFLGIIPKKWGRRVPPKSAYSTRDVGEILSLMGLKLERHEVSSKSASPSPVCPPLHRLGQNSIRYDSGMCGKRPRVFRYIIAPTSWSAIEALATRRNEGRLTVFVPIFPSSNRVRPHLPSLDDDFGDAGPPKLSYLDAGKINWM